MRIEETIYSGRNNIIGIKLSADGVALTALQYAAITRCQLLVGATLLDSAVTPALFDLTQTDRIVIKPGAATLTEGCHQSWLVIFDADNTLGIVVGELLITVKSGI